MEYAQWKQRTGFKEGKQPRCGLQTEYIEIGVSVGTVYLENVPCSSSEPIWIFLVLVRIKLAKVGVDLETEAFNPYLLSSLERACSISFDVSMILLLVFPERYH